MSDEPSKPDIFRIVHAKASQAEWEANELAEDYVLSNICFYQHEGHEKVAMLFVRKPPVALGSVMVPFRKS